MKQLALPPENDMNRSDALNAFIAVVNAVEPDHPYYDSPYPVGKADVNFGWTRSSYAMCGPAKGEHKINYSTRMTYINRITRERHLALITHEIAHISAPTQIGLSDHPPEFWHQMSQHALQVKEELENGDLYQSFPHVNIGKYQNEVVKGPSWPTVDRRYWSVAECSETIRLFLNGKTDAFQDYLREGTDYGLLSDEDKRITVNLTESSESTKRLIHLPGIGEQTVLKIGSEYNHAEGMVDELELDESLRKIVSPQYHDDLWYALRVGIDRRYLREEDRSGLLISSPDRSLYFENGNRRIPTQSEFRRHIQQKGY